MFFGVWPKVGALTKWPHAASCDGGRADESQEPTNQSRPIQAPNPLIEASEYMGRGQRSWMMHALQLKTLQKANHQSKSALILSFKGIALLDLEYEAARSKILRLKVLPPRTTYEQWDTKPPARSRSFLVAQPLSSRDVRQASSFLTFSLGRESSILSLSMVIPKKVVVVEGEVTFFQETEAPRNSIALVIMVRWARQESKSSAIIRKSSR